MHKNGGHPTPREAAAILPAVNYALLLFPDFSLILLGYLICRFTPLDRRIWEAVEALVYYFLFPVLLFHSIVRSPLDLRAASDLITAGLLLGLVAVLLAYALPHLPWLGRRVDRRDAAASAQVAFRFNSFIALALAERLGGPQGLQMIAVLIGLCVPLFNIAAVWPMARHGGHRVWGAIVRNPLIIATTLGLACNLVGLRIPDWLTPTFVRIGNASLALGLMSAGAGMQFAAMAGGALLASAVLSIRHLVLPLVAIVLVRLLRLESAQATMLMSFSALPTASTCYVLAQRMGYNGPYVAGLVTLSTILGVLSLPFAFWLASSY